MVIVTLLARSINSKLTSTTATLIARLSSTTRARSFTHRFFSALSASHSQHDPVPVGNSVSSPPRKLIKGPLMPNYFETGRYICTMCTTGLEFTSGKELLDYYVKTLQSVVGSEEEARKKIYLVSCEHNCFSFGAEIDEETSNKLEDMPGVSFVFKDFFGDAIFKSSKAHSTTKFIPHNWNHRLFNIFEYSKSFKGEKVEDPGHWLFSIHQPFDATEDDIVDYCVELLTKVLGSEKEARASLYVTWCARPFGFGAEIDKKTATELLDLPNVIEMLPDYAFDIKKKDHGDVLIIPPPIPGDNLKRPFYMFFEDEGKSDKEDILHNWDVKIDLDSDIEDHDGNLNRMAF